MRFKLVFLSTTMLAFSTAAYSETMVAASATVDAAADAADDKPIIVEGERGNYGASRTSTGTKTDTPVKDIPQAMTIITEQQIEDQQLRSIADALYFVPGATPGTGESNRDQITLRGNNTTADFFVNGIRDDVQYFRDFYNVDRLEVLKGPNAMIFGRGGGGGIVNRVTKRSSLIQRREVSSSLDSFGSLRFTGDFDQPLANNVGVRLNGVYENGDSFRRHVDLERYGVNPAVGILAGPDTRIDLAYEYYHDRRTTDRGLPSIGGKPLKGFDKIFFGDPDDSVAKADVHVAGFAVEHRFSDGLTLKNRTQYGDYDKFYQNVFANSAVLAPNPPAFPEQGVTLSAYNSRNDRRNLISQTDLIWENRLGGIDQTLLVGFEIGHQQSRNLRLSGTIIDGSRVPLSDPTQDKIVIYANGINDADNSTDASVAAVYIQDQIRISPMFEIVAGLRFDSFKLEVEDFHGAGTEFKRTDNLWSPRLGLIFKPIDKLSIYASYSRSYLPQSGDQFGGLTLTTAALKPERFDNYEIGAKWEPVEGLLATVAAYQLDRTNTRAIDPQTQQSVLTGAQRSKGIEVGLERSINDNWQISAGYAWQKAEITETTAAAPEGRKVPLVPKHSLSLWMRYDFTDQLGAGLGAIARSKSYASISNSVSLPGYARIDGAVFYKITRDIEAQLNVENIFGADYFPTAHSDNNIAPAAPTTAKVGLRFRI